MDFPHNKPQTTGQQGLNICVVQFLFTDKFDYKCKMLGVSKRKKEKKTLKKKPERKRELYNISKTCQA